MKKKKSFYLNHGDIYSFKTSPFTKFSNKDTGRYACLKILSPVICMGTEEVGLVGFVVLDKVFDHAPTLNDIKDAHPLVQKSFAYGEKTAFERMSKKEPKPEYAVHSTDITWECTLIDFSYLGNVTVLPEEEDMRKDLRSFSTWQSATGDVEAEWRWHNDKDNLLRECKLSWAEQSEKEKLAKERYENRLRNLTWEKAQNDIYFERWIESPPFPPEAFTNELRVIIKSVITDLQILGKKPSRPKVRNRLKSLIAEITSLDIKYDGVIETEEREDIYEVLYELTYLSKQAALMDEVGDWHYQNW